MKDKKLNVISLDRTSTIYPPPKEIFESVTQALHKYSFTNYIQTRGIPELQTALVNKLHLMNNISVSHEQILITVGSSMAIVIALILSTRKKGFILCPNPFYPPYDRLIKTLRLKSIYYPLLKHNKFIPTIGSIKSLLNSKKVSTMIINSPSNPTGMVLRREILEEIIELSNKYGFDLISDEAYENFVYEGKHISPASINIAGDVFSIFSFSKTYAMSGWRLGYMIVPTKLTTEAEKLYRAMVINTPLFAQRAGLAAMSNRNFTDKIHNNFLKQRNATAKILTQYNVDFICPQGGLCFWIDISQTGLSSEEFVELCLKQAKIIVQAGTAFGSEGKDYIRASFSGPYIEMLEGVKRLGSLYKKLCKKR